MLDRYFNVLLVDDEPDVLAVSKLALRGMKLYGLPLRVHTAASKADAIRFLTEHPEGGHVALAIIDVVMETDHAGLELCRFIRGELKNHVVPLVIRTGQAGLAPERTVIDEYEISGYVNKVEVTEGRLYSLIKAGVRQYSMTAYDFYASQLLYHVITNLRSAARFRRAVEMGLTALSRSRAGRPIESINDSHCLTSTTFHAGSGELADAIRGRTLAEKLASSGSSQPLSPTGDHIVVSDDHLLIHIEPTRDFDQPLDSVWSIGTTPPPFVVKALYMSTKQIQVLMSTVARGR